VSAFSLFVLYLFEFFNNELYGTVQGAVWYPGAGATETWKKLNCFGDEVVEFSD